MDPFTVLIAAGAALVAISVVRITWKAIRKWMNKVFSQKTWLFWNKNRAVHFVKQQLANGQYEVVGGVFDRNLDLVDSQKWAGNKLDHKLLDKFEGRNKVYIQRW